MSEEPKTTETVETVKHELAALRKEWWWLALLGAGLIVLGTIAISVPFAVGVAFALFFGILLLIAGVGQLISAFWEGRWSGFLLHLLTAVLYLVVGFLTFKNPEGGLAALTLLLAAFLIVTGIFRIILALQFRFHNWGWPLLSGIVSLLLGVIIWGRLPESSEWVLGIFLGVEMIFNGWTFVMLAFNVRAIPEETQGA